MRKLTLLVLALVALFAFMSPPGHSTAARASTATVGMALNTYLHIFPGITSPRETFPQTTNETIGPVGMTPVGTTSVDDTFYAIADVPRNAHTTIGEIQVRAAATATKTVLKCPFQRTLSQPNSYASNVHRHALII